MRAAIFKGPNQPLTIENISDPVPDADQIVFQVGRCGICGTDVHLTSGHGYFNFPPGTTPGHEFAGEVVAIGSAVTRFKIGDRVSAMPLSGCGRCPECLQGMPQFCAAMEINSGGFAEYVKADERNTILLPRSLTIEDGALVEPLAVSYHGVKISGIKPGAKVLVFGAGPIGLAAIFWARHFKAGKIAVAASSRSRENYAYAMGADIFLDPAVPVAEAAIAALGSPPDIILECAGVVGMLEQSVQIIRHRGTIVVLGNCIVPDAFVPSMALRKEVRLQFSMVYSLAEFEEVARTLDAGHVEARSMISHTISLTELPDFFETFRHANAYGKVQIDPSR